MAKNILTESTKSKFKVLEHKPKNVLKRIQGVLSDFKSNRNGRIYPRELWENVLNSDYVKEMIESHGLVGELDHPEERLEISLQNVSHVINDMWIEGDSVMGTIDILPTPSGKIVSELIDYGTDIGISSRGAGSVGAGNIVDPDYQFVTFDFVARPSCEAARLNMIVESVQPEIDNNSDDKVKSILEGYKTNLKETELSTVDKEKIIKDKLYPIIKDNWSTIFSDEWFNREDMLVTLPDEYSKSVIVIDFKSRKNPYFLANDTRGLDKLKQDLKSSGLKGIKIKTKKVKPNFSDNTYIELLSISFNDILDKLKESNTTSSFIDAREIVTYAEFYLSDKLNSSVGIAKRDDGQYMITMSNDDETISKWLELHNLNESNSQSYANMAAIDMCKDALSDKLGVDWRKKSLVDIEDIVHDTVYKYNEANVQPEYENEDFYGDEADANAVYKYILDNEIPKENKTTETRINESEDTEWTTEINVNGELQYQNGLTAKQVGELLEFAEGLKPLPKDFFGDEEPGISMNYEDNLDDSAKIKGNKLSEGNYIIKQATGIFGTYDVCDWEADSPEQAVKEFLEANPKYKEGHYGKITAVLKENDNMSYAIQDIAAFAIYENYPDFRQCDGSYSSLKNLIYDIQDVCHLSDEDIKNIAEMYGNKVDKLAERIKKVNIYESAMSDQEVYKTVLGWYKDQIEKGNMSLNQCYELLSDKAKVSLNKMVDQSKIKESMINTTINKLIKESVELNKKN